MRYLSWDDVRGLEKFLVEDNDEAIGIEIHTGLYDRTKENGVPIGYSRPDTVKKLSLAELAGGDFIKLGSMTLCAVVGNRLYYKDSRNWVYNTGTDVAHHGRYYGSNYEYERAVLTFNCPIVPLPKEEVLALKQFLVRNNKRVEAIKIMPGCRGIGGSNTSGFSPDYNRIVTYPIELLDNQNFLWVEGVALCALVNDVLHLCYTDSKGKKQMFTLDYRERDQIMHGDSIGYDTISATEIVLMLR